MAGREGTVFGPYRLTRRLGGGASGEVYLGEGPTPSGIAGQVAVKVLAGTAADPTTREVARLAQEVSALQQPNVVPVHGILQHDSALAVVMALAQGGSLGDTLAATRPDGTRKVTLPLAAPVVARLVGQLSRALDAAHAAGVVHGDLKPNNVFVRTSPSGAPLAAVADFGQSVLMRTAVEAAARGPAAGSRYGWAGAQLIFAAPEQLRGHPLPASDQYGLGALAYLLLTGEVPLVGDAAALLDAIPSQPVASPSSFNAELSGVSDAVLLRALAKDPQRRFASVGEFAAALDHALAAPVGAAQRAGVTQAFADLSGSHPPLRRPPDGSPGDGTTSGVRLINMTGATGATGASVGASGVRPRPAPSGGLPSDTSPRTNRRLAIVTGAAVVVVLLTCALGFTAFAGSSILPHIQLSAKTAPADTTPAPTANATATVVAKLGEAAHQSAVGSGPVFQDKLTSDSQHWATSGKSIFFGSDGLHIANTSAEQAMIEDAPDAAAGPFSNELVRADVTMVRGQVNNYAGVRFLTSPNGDYYAFVVSPEGKYQVWHRHAGWTFLTTGLLPQLKRGLNQHNTLEVLVNGRENGYPVAWLYVNGQTIGQVVLNMPEPSVGGAGLIVLDSDTEVVFTNFALYGSND